MYPSPMHPKPLSFLFFLYLTPTLLQAASPFPYKNQQLNLNSTHSSSSAAAALRDSKKYEGTSHLVHLWYHMGPVLSSPINLYLIWYGRWLPSRQAILRDFLLSLSDPTPSSPSVAQWWSTVALYADQTGSNVTRRFTIAREVSDPKLSRGISLTCLSVQQVIADAVATKGLPVDHRNGVYLLLTARDVRLQDFCRQRAGSTTSLSRRSWGTRCPTRGWETAGRSARRCVRTPLPFRGTCRGRSGRWRRPMGTLGGRDSERGGARAG